MLTAGDSPVFRHLGGWSSAFLRPRDVANMPRSHRPETQPGYNSEHTFNLHTMPLPPTYHPDSSLDFRGPWKKRRKKKSSFSGEPETVLILSMLHLGSAITLQGSYYIVISVLQMKTLRPQ